MPLTVLIVGGGIAGLGAAIALGREGHSVVIFEKSSFSSEVGAALHIGPQAVHVLEGWGIDLSTLDPSVFNAFKTVSISDDHSKDFFHDTAAKRDSLNITSAHLLAHRQDLHDLLRATAEALPNVHLRLSSAVTKVDADNGAVALADGSSHVGDLVIGADGTHSVSVDNVEKLPQVASSKNMYRFMVPVYQALEHASDALAEWDYETQMMDYHDFENDRYLIIHPCRGGKTLNMVTIQPDQMDNAEFGDSWNTPGTLEDLKDILQGYPERVLRLVRQAQDIKHWREANRHCPSTFLRGRLVLIGDAAHPIKPYYAAGAATAIEDAGVLGTIFRRQSGDSKDIDACLRLYNKIRYSRGVTIKYMSEPEDPAWDRDPKDKMSELLGGETGPDDMEEYMWAYDSFATGARALESVKW